MNRRHALTRFGALACLAGTGAQLAACAAAPRPREASSFPTGMAPPGPPHALLAASRPTGTNSSAVLALGEIHDNAVQHSLRLRWLQILHERGGRFCVAMEQLDAARQDPIDAVRAASARTGAPVDARTLAQAGGFSFDGWDWVLYEPVIAWALRQGLPVIGANLANAQTAAIARNQPHELAQARPADWSDSDETRQQREIGEAHCGVLPGSILPAMARAQRARDATMAQAVLRALAAHRLPVVLLAGNGHVRRDLGVPRYLAERGHTGAVLSVGFVERPLAPEVGRDTAPSLVDDPAGHYDWLVLTDAQPRPDPCAGLRGRMGSGGRALIDRARPVGQ